MLCVGRDEDSTPADIDGTDEVVGCDGAAACGGGGACGGELADWVFGSDSEFKFTAVAAAAAVGV